ncbi:MAG: alpha-galactosidase [Treponema sp.]|jgi:alpha-galactosidase|nr:alpha-galactosidase [Treponema sp.]
MPHVLFQTRAFRVLPDTPRTAFSIPIASWTYTDLCNAIGEAAELDEREREPFVSSRSSKDVFVYPGGWQSWSAGWELGADETLPRKVLLLGDLIKLTNRDGDTPRRGEITGHFLMYLRSGDTYLCIASCTSIGGVPLPPVSFRINRKKRRITAEVFCPGKQWALDDVMAELYLFACRGYFELKDTVAFIYKKELKDPTFSNIAFLRQPEECQRTAERRERKRNPLGGYESWYNHYTHINENVILDDLTALSMTDNLIKLVFLDKNKPAVFQIDDGWEQCVGQWEIDTGKFPNGLQPLAETIERQGFIPGLWIAPFIVTKRSKIFSERYEWLLKDEKGKPVVAGFNHLWDGRYYCLDLSRDDVIVYIQGLVNTVIDWGFRYIKIDFLYAGYLSGDFARGGAPHDHYECACSRLTEQTVTASNMPVAYLGCGLPLGTSFRHFPLSRIGADTREEWDWTAVKFLRHVGRPSAYISLLDTIGRSFFDTVLYCNDPDVAFLRTHNCTLTENEKELIALVNFLLAGQVMISDSPLRLDAADIRLTKRIAALYEALADDEYGAVRIARDVFRLISRSGAVSGIINLSNRPYPLPKAFLSGRFLVDHRQDGACAPHSISIQTDMSPCRMAKIVS